MKVALVTGSGTGDASATALPAAGCRVVLRARPWRAFMTGSVSALWLLCIPVRAVCAPVAEASGDVASLSAGMLRDEVMALRTQVAAVPDRQDAASWAQRQRAAFSERWRPRVDRAAAGDALALWLLYDCAALPELDHSGLDTSRCTETQGATPRPVPELASIGFARAIALATVVRGPMGIGRRCQGRAEGCELEEAERELQAQLEVAEQEGVLDRSDSFGVNICPMPPAGTPRSEADLHCWRLARRLLTLSQLAPRAFSLRLPPEEPQYVESAYGQLGPVPSPERNPMAEPGTPQRSVLESGLVDPTLSPEKRDALERHLRSEDAFYTEVWLSLESMRIAIAAQLARDPRWRVLLREQRTYGRAERLEPRTVSYWQAKAAPEKYQDRRDASYMGRYIGQYRGRLISNGTSEALTVLHNSGNGTLTGRYLAVYDAPQVRVEVGRIDNCLPSLPDELICTWDDRYGFGTVTLLFNADASEFHGNWRANWPGIGFYRMEREYWERPLWSGIRQ